MAVYHQDRRAAIIEVQVCFVAFAFIIYVSRLYTRLLIVRNFGVDDYLMGFAVLLSIGSSITACIGTKYGWGLHVTEIVDIDFPHLMFVSWILQIIFTICTSFIKASILYFYLRFATTGTYRKIVWGSIAFITVWVIIFTCVVVFQCSPISAYWTSYMGYHSHCFTATIPLIIHGMTNTLTDLYVFILPMPMMWKVQLPKKQRIGLIAIFGVGFATVAAGSIRLYYTIMATQATDFTWIGYDLWTWEAIEINLGIICACVPTIKPLIFRLFPSLLSLHTNTSPDAENSSSMLYGTQARPRNGKCKLSNIYDGGKCYAMGTITTATTTTKPKGAARGDSEEYLTTPQDNAILQVTSFESTSHVRTNSEMDLANAANLA